MPTSCERQYGTSDVYVHRMAPRCLYCVTNSAHRPGRACLVGLVLVQDACPAKNNVNGRPRAHSWSVRMQELSLIRHRYRSVRAESRMHTSCGWTVVLPARRICDTSALTSVRPSNDCAVRQIPQDTSLNCAKTIVGFFGALPASHIVQSVAATSAPPPCSCILHHTAAC